MGLFSPNVEKMEAQHDVQGLIKALGYKEHFIASGAAKALGRLKSVDAVEPLIAAISYQYYPQDAMWALGQIGDVRAVDKLIVYLLNYRSSAAARALGELGDNRAINPLISALNLEPEELQVAAVWALGNLRNVSAVDALLNALGNENASIRKAATEALKKIGWQPSKDKIGVYYWLNMGNADKCAEIGTPAIESLITALKHSRDFVRETAAEALGQIGDARAEKPLINALKDKSERVRTAVIKALGQIPVQPGNDEAGAAYWISKGDLDKCVEIGTPAVGPLIDALSLERVQRWVPKRLVQIGDKRAVKPLIDRLNGLVYSILSDTSHLKIQGDLNDMYSEVITALGQFGDARAIDPLIIILKGPYSVLSENAAKALGKIGDARAVEPLITVLKNHYPYVRKAAAEALGQIGDRGAIASLIATLKDSDKELREVTAVALGEIGDERAIEPLISTLKDNYHEVRFAAAVSLVKIGMPAVEHLIAALKDAYRDVRWSAAYALGQIGDVRAMKPLMAALADLDVREAASNALEELSPSPDGD
jgi:HEAT repeat protein